MNTNLVRAFKLILIVSLLGVRTARIVFAGANLWTSNGPYGGHALTLSVDPLTPTTLYVTTDEFAGVFKSTDAGDTWTAINSGLPDYHLSSLAIDPLTPSTLYVGTIYNGIYKSPNNGNAWTSVNAGLTDPNINALVIDPVTTTTLYAGTIGGGVFKSADGGSSWNAVNTGLTNLDIRSLAVDPTTPTTLYAGGYSNGDVFKSTDSGISWSTADTGLPSYTITALAIDPVTPTTVYALTYGMGVYKTTNGGGNWSSANVGLTCGWNCALVIDPITTTTLYVGSDRNGVYKSTNSGGNWTQINTGITNLDIRSLGINPLFPEILYAGSRGGGVYKSTNGGGSWSAANTGLTAIHIKSLAVDPLKPTTLYAGSNYNGGLFKSTDGGSTWISKNGMNENARDSIFAIAIDPMTPTILYAATGDYVQKSTDGGDSWTRVMTGLTNNLVYTILIDPLTTTTLYAGTYGGVFKSTNGGSLWINSSAGLTSTETLSLAVDPVTTTTLYAGTYSGGVFKSTDGGGNWTSVNNGLTQSRIYSLAIDPVTPTTLYAGSYNGDVFKSIDGGSSWTEANPNLTSTNIVALAIDPTTPSTLYAGSLGGGVLKSTNGGDTWTANNNGLDNKDVNSLLIDPSTPTKLFVGTNAGVFEIKQVIAEYSVSGKVITSLGDAIPGVTVTAGSGHTDTTNALGEYLISGLPVGNYTITALKDSYSFLPTSSTVQVINTNITDLYFTGTLLPNNFDLDVSSAPIILADWNYQIKQDQPFATVLEVAIANHGRTEGRNITVEFFNGLPSSGDLLASTIVPSVPAGGSSTAQAKWTHATSPSVANIYVQVWADPTQSDINLANNISLTGTPAMIAFAGSTTHPYQYNPDSFNFPNWSMTPADFQDEMRIYTEHSSWQSTWRYIFSPLLYQMYADEGHCFGMSQASIIYWDTPLAKPVYKDTYLMTQSEAAVDIRDQHVRQILVNIAINTKEIFKSESEVLGPIHAYNEIRQRLIEVEPRPSIINGRLHWVEDGQSFLGGHSVVAYKIAELGEDKYVFIYDNRFPLPANPNADVLKLDFISNHLVFGQDPEDYYYTSYISDPVRSPQEVTEKIIWSVSQSILGYLVDNNFSGLFFSWESTNPQSINLLRASSTTPPSVFLVSDTMGRRIGFDQGILITEIPNAELSDLETGYYLSLPADQQYTLTVSGSGSDSNTLALIIPNKPTALQETEYVNFSIPLSSTATTIFGKTAQATSIHITDQPDVLPTSNLTLPIYQYIYLPILWH